MNRVTVYTMQNCPYCLRAKELLKKRSVSFQENLLPMDDDSAWDALFKKTGMKTMPQILHGEKLIGGFQELTELDHKDQLESLKK